MIGSLRQLGDRMRALVPFAPCDALHVDQHRVIEFELPLQHPQRHAAVLFDVTPDFADDVEEIHAPSSCASRAVYPVAPSVW